MPQSLMLLKVVTMPHAPPGWRSLWWILHHPDVLDPLEHLCSVDYGYSHSNCSLIDAKTPGILLELLLNSLPDQKQKKQTSRHFDFFGVWDHPSPSSPSKIQVIPRLYHFCRACSFQGWWSFFPIGFCFPPAAPWIRLFQEGFPCILPF